MMGVDGHVEHDPSGGTLTVGGIVCSRMDRAELATAMVRDTMKARSGELAEPRIVISSNGMVVARYHSNPAFRAVVDAADIVDVDGMPLVMATKLLCRKPLRERVATTDFIHDACKAATREGIRFFFLGASPGVADEAARNLTEAYPGLQIVGVRHGYFTPDHEEELCAEIRASGADVLWVAMGSPFQERFALRNRSKLNGLSWIRTCGGLFDFCAGRVPRAPGWMQAAGFEWLFRTLQEPRRLAGRYFRTNPAALFHLLTKTHD
jgi:N-acetylglucosaminyldiphosphoundecaprenol N-acetyl-beta-D-mannosaminyltransferase